MAEAAELQQLPLKLANFSIQLGYSYSNYDRTLAHAQFSIFQKDSNTNIWMLIIKKAECHKKNMNLVNKNLNSKLTMIVNSFLTLGKLLKISVTSSVN